MAYATVAMVTDYDCWREEHCSLQEILQVLNDNYQSAQKLIFELVPDIWENPIKFTPENKFAVVTRQERVTADRREILDIILR